jgi:hypothetical protein
MFHRVLPPLAAVAALSLRLGLYKLMAIPFGGLSFAMCQYDCGWYVRLATQGYGSDSTFADYDAIPNWAFFPLFPLLLRAAYAVVPLGPYFVGMVLSNLLFLAFILLSVVYLRRTRQSPDALLWAGFVVLFPFGYIFSAIYSEGLFALLTVAALLLLRERRVLLASVVSALLCATRPTGVLVVVLIIADRGLHLWRDRGRADRVALLGETLLPIAVAPLGLSLSMLAQYWATGDALAFSHVQVLWDREWAGPVAMLMRGLGAWDWHNILAPKGLPSESYDAVWALLGLAASCWMVWRRRFAEAWLCAASILLPLSTGLHSLPRFVATNPFFLFALFDLLTMLRSPRVMAGLFGAAGLLHGVVLVFWFISASSTY